MAGMMDFIGKWLLSIRNRSRSQFKQMQANMVATATAHLLKVFVAIVNTSIISHCRGRSDLYYLLHVTLMVAAPESAGSTSSTKRCVSSPYSTRFACPDPSVT